MSGKYGYEDRNGSRLEIRGNEAAYGCRIDILGDSLLEITEEAAPSVAQAIIALSRAEAVLIPGKLPEATIEEVWKGQLHCVVRNEEGIVFQWEVTRDAIENARRCARDAMAVARAIEEYLDSEEHTNKVLSERRNKLAAELTNNSDRPDYLSVGVTSQRAIDRIIALEDKLGEAG